MKTMGRVGLEPTRRSHGFTDRWTTIVQPSQIKKASRLGEAVVRQTTDPNSCEEAPWLYKFLLFGS